MDAIALRAGTRGVTPLEIPGTIAATAPTNGPSSSGSTAGGGPTPAPSRPALLGTLLLPATGGAPQALSLPDGSILVPLARVDSAGRQTPLTGGAGSAPLITTPREPVPISTAAPVGVAVRATAADISTKQGIDNTGFLYNSQWYAKYAEAGGIDTNDSAAVEKRVAMATYAHIVADEPEIGDFVVTDFRTRRVDPVADRDLLTVNPNSLYYVEVLGRTGDGATKSIPSVMNTDGSVFVDPRLPGR